MEMNDDVSVLLRYFTLTETQQRHFEKLGTLYHEWNQKINLISRKDMEHLYLHHILHSLSIAKVISFADGTKIMDVGTGGGLPGIPLAILFPKCSFLLVDSIGKKVRVVQEIVNSLGLNNALALNSRAENLDDRVDFITGRAVSSISEFYFRVERLIIRNKKTTNTLPNGLLYLAGGDIEEDLKPFKKKATIYPISTWFSEEYFERKKVVHIKK